VASERAGACSLQGLTLPLPSDPSRQARKAPSGGSAKIAGLPVSAVGLTTRLRRGAEGGRLEFNALAGDTEKY